MQGFRYSIRKRAGFFSPVSLALIACGLWSSAALAQTSPREAAIARFELAYAQVVLVSAESPFMNNILMSRVKSVNPGVGRETWARITPAISAAMMKAITEKGGPLDTTLRAAVVTLTDAELDKLIDTYEDPAYRKFQAATNRPDVQDEINYAFISNALALGPAVNGILAQNGLNQIH